MRSPAPDPFPGGVAGPPLVRVLRRSGRGSGLSDDGDGTPRSRALALGLSPVGPPGEGRICERTVSTEKVYGALDEPVPRPTVLDPDSAAPRGRVLGAVRLPIAGPYRPWARLHVGPEGGLYWTVRLWDRDRARTFVASSEALRRFARVNRLGTVERAIDALLARARRETGA